MSLRAQAMLEFELPAAPQRIDELASPYLGSEAWRVHAPAGRFLLICSDGALALAFEATLFDLLAESRYPAPRPRRAKGGSLIAPLQGGAAAAACYAWPPGEELAPAAATVPQLLELGRLLARLHQLGEVHPASVGDPGDAAKLLSRLVPGPDRDLLAPVLEAGLPPLPSGAVHGGLRPARSLFVGDRCSAVLPSGFACSAPLVLDLAEAALGWMLGASRPAAVLRALVSGYQSLRRLLPEEAGAMWTALRFAAAREGARRAGMGRPAPLAALKEVEELGEAEVRSASGAEGVQSLNKK
jgi:Ser/Thr protein kinase RdoA (MazF antagonist)